MDFLDDDELGGCAVGIDLGTTNTVVSTIQNGRLELIRNESGGFLHPSVVAFTRTGGRLVGAKASLRRTIDAANTIFSAKRLIGRPFTSADVQRAIENLPYTVEAGSNQEPIVTTRVGALPIIDVSSYVLEHIKELAEEQLSQPVTQCVVTVPAHFADGQRAATREAAERAGFEVLRVLNEPTAAAIAYGLDRDLHQRIAIFDLGGGTIDVTILAIQGNLFEVLATGGDPYLGGDDFDQSLAAKLAEDFEAKHGTSPRGQRHAMARLLAGAEQIKKRLSDVTVAEGRLEEIAYGEGGVALHLDYKVTRSEFEDCATPFVDRALHKAEAVLEEAGLAASLIDEVVLVGGSTLVPLVRTRVADLFGKTPRSDVDPMLAVAAGATVQAESLSAPPEDHQGAPLLMDVTAHGLGVVTAGRFNDRLIDKNTPIPAVRKRVFSTASDNQTSVEIKICEGDERHFDADRALGTLRLEGLEPGPRGQAQIEVSFVLDADGILQVAARDLATGRSESATITVNGVGDR